MEIETNSTSVVTEQEQLQHQQTMTPNTQQAINQQQLTDEMVRFELLKTLEYYFSSKNLTKDQYLISQMDNEAFVALEEIAKFRKIKQLTSDLDLMKDIIRQSSQLELDASETKVRSINGLHGGSISTYRPIGRLQAAPSPQQRSILILREVAPEATQEQIVELFNNREPMCSPCEKCESAGNELWYITFANEEQAQRALQYLKGELVTFMDRPIKARIKSHVIPRSNTLGSASKQGNTSGITLTPTSTPPPVQSPLLFSTSQLQSPTFVSSSSPTSSVQTPNSASFINAPNSTISPPHNQMLIPNPQYVSASSQYAFPVGANQPPANYIIQSQDAAAGFESIQWPPNLRPYNSAPNTQSQPQIFYINNPNIYPNPVPGVKQDNNFIITQAPTGSTQQPPTYMPNQPVIALNSLSSLPPEHTVVYQQSQPSQQLQTRSGVFSQQSEDTSVSKSQESPISNSVSNTSQNNNQQKPSSNSMQFFNTPFYQQLPTQTRSQNPEGSQLAASPALSSQNSLSISINQPPSHPQQAISNSQTAEYPPNSYFIHTAQGSNQPPTISYLHQYQAPQQHQQQPPNVYYDFLQQQQQQEGNKDAQSQQGKTTQIQAIQLPIHLPLISNPTTFTPHATLQIGTTGQLNHQQHQQQPTILFYNSIQPGQHPTHNIIINPALVNPSTGQQGGLQPQQQSQQGPTSPKMAANAYAQYQQGFYQPHSHYQRKNNAGQNNDGSKPTLFSPTTQAYPKYNNNNMNKGKYQNKNYQSNSGSAKNTAFAYYNSPNMSHQGNSQHYNQHQSGGHHAPLHHNHHHVGYSTNYAAIQQVYSVAYNPVHSAANYDSNSSSGISTSSALSSTSHTPIRGNTNMRERSNGVESPECSDEGYVVSSSSSMPTSHTPKSDTAPAANVVATSIEQDSSTSPVKKSSKEEQAVIDPAIISISKSADSIPSSPTIIKSGGLMDVVAKTTIPETLANILTLSSNNTQDSAQADMLSPTKSNSHYQQQAGNNKYDNNTHRSSGNNPRGVNNRSHYIQKKNSPENGTNMKNRSNNNRKALQDNDQINEETKNSSCNASHPKDSTPEQIESNFSSTVSTPSSFQNEEELMNSLNNCWNKKLTFAEIVQKTNSSSPTKSPTNEDSETTDLGGESNGSEKAVLSPSTSPIMTSNSVQSNNSVITAE